MVPKPKGRKTLDGHIRQGFLGGPTYIEMTPELELEFEQDRKEFFESMDKRIEAIGGWEQFRLEKEKPKN